MWKCTLMNVNRVKNLGNSQENHTYETSRAIFEMFHMLKQWQEHLENFWTRLPKYYRTYHSLPIYKDIALSFVDHEIDD